MGKPNGEPTTALREYHHYAPSNGRRQAGAGEEPDVLLDALVLGLMFSRRQRGRGASRVQPIS